MEEEESNEGESAQWMPECDDCDDNVAEHYCNTCGDKLCTGCKDHHLSRKKNRNHQVVPYHAKIKAKQKSLSTCEKHPGEPYVLYCRPCQLPVCVTCVAEACGKLKHELTSIPEAFTAVKDAAMSILNQMETEIKPALKRAYDDNTKTTTEITNAVDIAEKTMKNRTQEFYNDLDLILEKNLKSLHEIKEKRLIPVVRDHEGNLNNVQSMLDSAMKEYEKNLRSDDPADLLNFMKDRYSEDPHSQFIIPPPVEVSLPIFSIGVSSKETLEKQFGNITINGKLKANETNKNLGDSKIEESEGSRATSLAGKEMIVTTKAATLPRIMSQSIKQFDIKCDEVNKVLGLRCHLGTDKLWMHDDRKIYLLDRKGHVIHKVDIYCRLFYDTGICITTDDDLLFGDYDGNKIMKIYQNFDLSTFLTKVTYGPTGLCDTDNGDLLVCLQKEKVVKRYNRSGTYVKEIGKRNLNLPRYVNENKSNNDICVSDHSKQIVVFRSSGEKRFTYTGDGTGFNPFDLCCDQLGNILITDYNNHRVHIIDRDGHFLQYLVSGEDDISYPVAIDIDSNGYAVVGELYSGIMKVYKYLQ